MNNNAEKQYELNKELAQMLKGGVIMDVTTPEQAKIAEEAELVPLWHYRESQPTFVQPVVFPE